MTIIRDSVRFAKVCATAGIPATCFRTLERGLRKLQDDGRQALADNPWATEAQIEALEACNTCVVPNGMAAAIPCIDGDAWARESDQTSEEQRLPSVDLMFLSEAGGNEAVFVEGKLGALGGNASQRPRHPTQSELKSKFDCSQRRLHGKISVKSELYVIFSVNAIEKMKNWFGRYNRADRALRLTCLCVRDLVGLVNSGVLKVSQCDKNRAITVPN